MFPVYSLIGQVSLQLNELLKNDGVPGMLGGKYYQSTGRVCIFILRFWKRLRDKEVGELENVNSLYFEMCLKILARCLSD